MKAEIVVKLRNIYKDTNGGMGADVKFPADS